nr:MAG TPA: hypothetical protein [Caudoviricetes sp.]
MKNHSNTTTKQLLASQPEWEVMHLTPLNAPEMENDYILTQDAYLTGTHENPYYTALALLVGHEVLTEEDVSPELDFQVGELAYYRVYWYILPEYADDPDAWRHCDWALPSYIEYVGSL